MIFKDSDQFSVLLSIRKVLETEKLEKITVGELNELFQKFGSQYSFSHFWDGELFMKLDNMEFHDCGDDSSYFTFNL
ncbi:MULTISPECIES: hypothetical protein [Sphingobacterium]|uniref:hypothetical protein n=1 Tax=Sphingobacterium TaxID=28453 RepID=UPI00257D538E|nr:MULTISPECIES: hypothetical protein [Sphingobacterium]